MVCFPNIKKNNLTQKNIYLTKTHFFQKIDIKMTKTCQTLNACISISTAPIYLNSTSTM